MFKKGLIMLTLAFVMMPMLAQAYTLTTRINKIDGLTDGQLQVNALPAQTSGAVVKAIANGTNVDVVIAPAAGYVVSRIQQNTTYLAVTPAGQTINIPATNTASQTINVWFDKKNVAVTAIGSLGGKVSPSGTLNLQFGAAKTYTFTPDAGQKVVSISGTPSGAAITPGLPAPVDTPVTVAFNVPATPVTMQASFQSLAANAGPAQNAQVGKLVTLNGSASIGATTFAWTQTGGPAVVLTGDTTSKPTFTAAAGGIYKFSLTVTDGAAGSSTAITSVTASVSNVEAMRAQCQDCHQPIGVGVASNVFGLYSASVHPNNPYHVALCYNCHVGADTGSHPGVAGAALKNICLDCHKAPYSAQGVNYVKSSHYTTTHVPGGVQCASCHNPHSTVAAYGAGTATGCQSCHAPGSPYGIYNADFTAKAPHGGGKFTVNGATAFDQNKTQFLTQGATCSDCHGHDNTINAGFAEGGHGKVSDDPMNAWNHYDWSARLNNGTRQNGNCDRCHTAGGFAKLLGDTDVATRLAPVANTPQAVLNCLGCHKTAEGELRIGATPAGNPTALSGGYFALYSSTAAALGAGNTKIEVQFPGFKNSSICIPCHSGRTTDKYVRDNIATLGTVGPGHAAIKNFSTLQGANYQHAANMGQTFIGKGAWEFTPGKYASFAANQTPHTTIGMAAGNNQGPCVGCHYSEEGKTHSLEINYTSTTCTPCHGSASPQVAKFAEFSSARFALDQTIRSKFAPLLASGDADLNTERAGYWRFGRFGKADGTPADYTTAQNAYGAWYNWQLVKTWDAAAWAHNPAYARQLVFDTLAYLQTNGTDLTGTQANATAAIDAVTAIDAAGKVNAKEFVNGNKNPNALCTGCHAVGRNAGAGYVQDNNGVRAITTEFGKWSHHVTGVALNDAHCAACHMEGKVDNGKIVVDGLYHMKDAKTYLRNADTDAPIAWDPAAPNHTNMDEACMSCHDANGASSTASVAIQAVINAINTTLGNGFVASALNPFGDTISNQYDQLSRGAVVAVKEQFDDKNTSHHGVRAARYTATNLDAAAFSNISSANFANGTKGVSRNSQPANATVMATVGTLYETGKFTAYKPFGTDVVLKDNAQVHCADCHTVGQWKANTTKVVNDDGTLGADVATVIGAHGSNNEYMLRNQDGSDVTVNAKTQMVCYICHVSNQYDGHTTDATGTNHNAAVNHGIGGGKYLAANQTSVNCNGNGNNTMGQTGRVNRLKISDATFTLMSSNAQGSGGASNPFANKCLNCHNAGDKKSIGGIHGNAFRVGNTTAVTMNATYKTYSGVIPAVPNTASLQVVDRKPYRFLPGLGNFRYNGGGSDDSAWERKALGSARAGCYTLPAATTAITKFPTKTQKSMNNAAAPQQTTMPAIADDNGITGSWGGCAHHGGAQDGNPTAVTRTSLRPTTY